MKPGSPAGHEEMRRHNLLLALGVIGGHWPIDKADLAKHTGLSWGSVTSITEELLKRGLVQAVPTRFDGRGRNPALFTPRKDARYSVGVDLGVTTVRAMLIDLEGATVDENREPSPITASNPPDQAIARCVAIVQKLVSKHKIPRDRLLGVGVGLAGTVNAESGRCLELPNLPRWNDVPVTRLFAARLRLPVMLDRSGNCVAFAELNYGAALRLSHAICLSLGDDLSAGFIFNDTVYRGAENLVGEIGRVVMTTGPASGKLSDLISNRAIMARWRSISKQTNITAKQIHDLAMAGNARAVSLFDEIGVILGIVIGNLVNLLNPRRVILGGRLANSRPLFERSMQESLSRTVAAAFKFDIQTSQLGEMDVAKGAAALLMARAFSTGEGIL